MLESDIKALYQRMAAADRPPTRVSIPAAHRSGRARLRRRRTRTIASPVLAAGAVLAIVFTGSLPAGRFGATHAPSDSLPAAEGAFPQHFSPLRPYASLGWLPGGIMKHAGQTNLTSTSLTISFGNPPGELDAFSAGICHLTGHVLTCPEELGSALSARQSLGRKVGLVNGHPAYWMPRGMRITANCHSIGNGPRESCKYTYDGFLKWQYVRGGWADVSYPTVRTALKIARNARFGPAVAPPARFALQLTGLPSGSYVDNLETTVGDQGRSEQYEVRTGRHDSPVITVSRGSSSKLACQYGVAAHHTDLVINGYQVEISHSTGQHEVPWQLCAPDADGLNVVIFQANNPTISNVDLFADHMRLLGPDQANWTTKPIG